MKTFLRFSILLLALLVRLSVHAQMAQPDEKELKKMDKISKKEGSQGVDRYIFDLIRSTDPPPTWALTTRALNHIAAGRFDDALVDGKLMIRLDQQSCNGFWIMAQALEAMDEDELAAQGFREATKRCPDEYMVLLSEGSFLSDRFRWQEAEPILQHAHRLDPTKLAPLLYLADCKIYLHQEQQAFRLLDSLEQTNPANTRVKLKRSLAFQWTGQYTLALEAVEAGLRLEPENRNLLSDRIVVLAKLGRKQQALQAIETLAKTNPKGPRYLLSKADHYLYLEYYAESAQALEQYLIMVPQDILARNNLAYAYQMMGDYKRAVIALQDHVRSIPSHSFAYNNLGWAQFMSGDTITAIQNIKQSITLNPLNAYAYYNRARFALATHSPEKACPDLLKAAELNFKGTYGPQVDSLLQVHCK